MGDLHVTSMCDFALRVASHCNGRSYVDFSSNFLAKERVAIRDLV
jgi:hypothetical protein